MRFRTFLKTGVEVLHLGMQQAESNAWPPEHWRDNPGRWRLFTPGIDDYLTDALADKSFGASIDSVLLVLEVADFAAWGPGLAFSSPEGWTSYSPKSRELRSVGRLDWLEIQSLTATQQLQAFGLAAAEAIARVTRAKRRPRDFDAAGCASEVLHLIRTAKVSRLSRAAWTSQKAG
jgi:hypothetical protein